MNLMTLLEQQLGPMAYPLSLCALLSLIILAERLVVIGYTTVRGKLRHDSLTVMTGHAGQPKHIQQEIAAVWLQHRQRRLASGIRLLQILALLSPLLGLLGTVVGLIQVFDTLGEQRGPIEPAMLASGLGIAMKTTAAGLIIAVPALVGAHGFNMWVDQLISGTEQFINLQLLKLDGVSMGTLP